MLDTAIALAAKAFEGRNDKGGQPYILHCLQVMYGVDQSDSELMQIAVLHDVVEDTEYSFLDLHIKGFSDRVVEAVKCLTHVKGESYDDYIARVATNADAIQVKLADLRHNSDILRVDEFREKDMQRLAKYHRAYCFLSQLSGCKARNN